MKKLTRRRILFVLLELPKTMHLIDTQIDKNLPLLAACDSDQIELMLTPEIRKELKAALGNYISGSPIQLFNFVLTLITNLTQIELQIVLALTLVRLKEEEDGRSKKSADDSGNRSKTAPKRTSSRVSGNSQKMPTQEEKLLLHRLFMQERQLSE